MKLMLIKFLLWSLVKLGWRENVEKPLTRIDKMRLRACELKEEACRNRLYYLPDNWVSEQVHTKLKEEFSDVSPGKIAIMAKECCNE